MAKKYSIYRAWLKTLTSYLYYKIKNLQFIVYSFN